MHNRAKYCVIYKNINYSDRWGLEISKVQG